MNDNVFASFFLAVERISSESRFCLASLYILLYVVYYSRQSGNLSRLKSSVINPGKKTEVVKCAMPHAAVHTSLSLSNSR